MHGRMETNSLHNYPATGVNPLDNLSAGELRKELTDRGRPVGQRKRKQELLEEFNDLRQGLNDVPALLQPTPQAKLET